MSGFILHSFKKYLLNICYVLAIFLGTGKYNNEYNNNITFLIGRKTMIKHTHTYIYIHIYKYIY